MLRCQGKDRTEKARITVGGMIGEVESVVCLRGEKEKNGWLDGYGLNINIKGGIKFRVYGWTEIPEFLWNGFLG